MKSSFSLSCFPSLSRLSRLSRLVPGVIAVASLVYSSVASADGIAALEKFLSSTRSGSASFTQTVTSPKRQDEAVARQKRSSGQFEFLRPDRFRFEYTKPFVQTIVADGQSLWLYDADLNQVTERKQQDVLGNTPAALIASSTDMKALKNVFDFKSQPDEGGLQWLLATPRKTDGQLQQVRLAFQGEALARLEITDGLGQVSLIAFDNWKTDTGASAERFKFKIPAGADVIRQ